MPQDREGGAEAGRLGHDYGEKIIAVLGVKKVKSGTNEYGLRGLVLYGKA